MFRLATSNLSPVEVDLAAVALADSNPLVAALASRGFASKLDLAHRLLESVRSGRPESPEDLLYSRPFLEDIDFVLAMEIRASRANPYDDGVWRAAEVKIGGKRYDPAGATLGHITGYVGKLTAEEYRELRGYWEGDSALPGSGSIHKRGRLFFSVRPDHPGEEESDEERIIRLREVRRSGKLVQTQGYLLNEMVGRGGLEQYYNQALRGRHILQRLRLTRDAGSRRRRFQPLGEVARAQNGVDLRLSLRLDIQRQVEDIMAKNIRDIANRPELVASDWVQSGVAIILDPRNGRLHAMVSFPSFDPNRIGADFASFLKDPAAPLLDRSVAGIYPPGSVAKPLVGLAALSEDRLMPGEQFFCDRVLLLAGARFTCLGQHGNQDIVSALRHSCNIFFYHTGEKLGGRDLYNWYTRLGLGHPTGIDISGEAPGMLPRNAFTRRGWATGNTYHLAIGQGMAVTPIQIAVAYAAIANAKKGVADIVRPHFLVPPLGEPTTPEGEALALESAGLDQPTSQILLDQKALDLVRQGLWEAVQGSPETGEGGTGRLASFPTPGGGFLIELAGKTGTAEWSEVVNGRVRKGVSHVWFACYAPFDRPEVVVVVMLPEAGGGGGSTCAPIAKEILRLWFNLPDRLDSFFEDEDALG
jgi:cell division protein FtsI/penicillin-binding protein 2